MIELAPTPTDAPVSSSSVRAATASRWLKMLGVTALGAVSFGAGWMQAVAAEPAKPAAAAAPTNCKAYNGGKCCSPTVTAHLTKEAVFTACGESDATFLGEKASSDACKYVFRVEGEKAEETFVEVYAPAQKDVPDYPNDPFHTWKKVGKVYVADQAKQREGGKVKTVPMDNNAGLWMPGKGFFVSVNASTKVCTKAEVKKLASSVK